MNLLIDGYLTGLTAIVWLAGATLGALTIAAPWAAAGWLLTRTARTLATSRAAWSLRARRSTRRTRSARP